jgi:DUF1365 family protein
MSRSALYVGSVFHRRQTPKHRFRKHLVMALLYLDEVDRLVRTGALSQRRFGPRSFVDADHLRHRPEPTLDERVRGLVRERCGRRPDGPIALLSQLRCWGLSFDPIRLYYCFEPAGDLAAIVAEVTNTPWSEQHAYVLDARLAERADGVWCFEADKVLHVSPFFGLDHRYGFRVGRPGTRLALGIVNVHEGREVFRAGLALERRPLGAPARWSTLARHPWMPAETLAAIHWQALRLWLGGATFHPHPHPRSDRGGETAVTREASR